MRAPYDSLEDFKAPARKTAKPPATKSLRLTGKTQILKPLARVEDLSMNRLFGANALHRFKWFHRSLAMGGAFAVILFALITLIDFAIYGPRIGPVEPVDVAINEQPDSLPVFTDEPFTAALLQDENSLISLDELNASPAFTRRRSVRPRAQYVAYRAPRKPEPFRNQLWVSQFVPTTLVIYIENGVIKTRSEPWYPTGLKRPLSLPN